MTIKTNQSDELRMSGEEFDRIMSEVLQVKPNEDKKIKQTKPKGKTKKALEKE